MFWYVICDGFSSNVLCNAHQGSLVNDGSGYANVDQNVSRFMYMASLVGNELMSSFPFLCRHIA